MKAIISAAGWKGAGVLLGLGQIPEPFLPLGDGTTTLSRTATTLSENGHEVYIAVGEKGYPYSRYIRWTAECPLPLPGFPADFPWDGSPWTDERLSYAADLGTVVQMPDPGGWTTSLDTFCETMDWLGEEQWDDLFLACGDMFVPRDCLEFILALETPFIFSFTAYHNYYGLDLAGAQFFRKYSEDFRRFRDERSWKRDKAMAPGHLGSVALRENGFSVHGHDIAPPHVWSDIDYKETYADVLKMAAARKA